MVADLVAFIYVGVIWLSGIPEPIPLGHPAFPTIEACEVYAAEKQKAAKATPEVRGYTAQCFTVTIPGKGS